jgi:outer membrane lipoprotein-sorting protein
MRQRIVISAVIIVLALLLAGAYFGLGWWRPTHATISQTAGGYDAEGDSATLEEVLVTAHQALDEIERTVRDYSATIVKQERIGSQLVQTVMFAKIREKPFSVYLNFLDRSDDKGVKGREVIYVQGRNGDKLLVHTPGLQDATLGTLSLPPNGFLGMRGERYPITEIGLANLCRQLIQRGEAAGGPGQAAPGQIAVKRYRHARINARACTLMEITYPVQERKNRGYLARVFLDDQLHFPIRVEVYELPRDRGQGPQLVEEYTYLDVKLNNGYSDADFDPKNPQYKFP